MKPFDLTTCRSKLEGHYLKTSTVPTSVWCKKAVVDIHQIYTRLSFVKDPEKPPAGTTQSELKHYTDIFTANKNGAIPKRILVQGQTGIGKSTFVKKLLVDWVEVNKAAGDEQAAVLKNFELVVAVNLKEVSKCQSLKDVIRLSNVFAKEDKCMTENLVDYISNNQEKVLLIFDGYDEYRSGCDSEIYEIFSGNSLRSCCVLITTRISKADELRGSEDLHAEITGFSQVDREDFMRRFLNSEEVSKLKDHLYARKLEELAKVPLLLLLFCILWREGQSKSFPNSKTKLYVDIVQFILNHSHSKQTADKTKTKQYVELKSFKEILSEIGKVALQSLLKDDHLFEYSQLSDSVCCDESIFIGLLQITEYSETLRPVGMVSFIHKSIQEFLAAWYVTYRCIPEGGNLDEISVKLEECLALENVFQFICGLSKDGASTVFRHLKSVRISDPSLDLSKAVPDVENETDEPLSDVTERQEKFRDLVLFLFAEVESKAKLSSSCLDSLGNILLFSDSFPNYLLEKAIDTDSWSLVLNGGSGNFKISLSTLELTEVAKIVVTKSSEASTFPKVAAFLQDFIYISHDMRGQCTCGFFSILCFRNGQFYFYITDFVLSCDSHTRLFTDTVVPSHSVGSSSGQLCLKFLKTLECYKTRCSMESLGVVIKRCNHLERIVCEIDENSEAGDSFCHLLKQVPNPDRCSLSIEYCVLTSTGAATLASLLPRFGNVTCLCLSLAECSTGAVGKLVAAIKHKTLQKLKLDGMNLGLFKALGQSLPELSALQTLSIGASVGCILQLVFPVVSESLPRLKVRGLTESSAEAVTRLIDVFRHRTFEELKLEDIHLTSAVAEVLGQLLTELSALRTLRIRRLTDCTDEAVTRLIDVVNHKTLEKLELSEIYLTSAVAESLGQSLPELSALQTLKIRGSDGCSLHLQFPVFSDDLHVTIRGLTECSAEVVSRIVAGIKHKTLKKLEVSKLESIVIKLLESLLLDHDSGTATKLLATITVEHKTLTVLELRNVCVTSAATKALCQLLPELSALRTLKISGLNTSSAETLTKLFAAIQHKSLEELILSRIHLTSAAAEALGQSLPELSALQTLEISGGWSLQHEDMEALFGKFKRPSSLKELRISDFRARGSLAQPIQNLSFFPCLETLHLTNLDIGEADVPGLLENLKFMPDLRVLHLWNNSLGPAIRLMVPYLLKHQNLESVVFPRMRCSIADLDFVQNAVNEKRPQLRIKIW